MDLEIEAKFVKVNHDEMRKKLRSVGAECRQSMRLMRRVIYHRPNDNDSFIRVRDEGSAVTLTYKHFHDANSIDGVEEVETRVDDFDKAVRILDETGMNRDAYQETKRETWDRNGVEIVLDEWPWLEPFIEIEGPDEESVRLMAEELGFDWSNAVFGGVSSVYIKTYKSMGTPDQAAIIINKKTPVIRFEDPVPEAFK